MKQEPAQTGTPKRFVYTQYMMIPMGLSLLVVASLIGGFLLATRPYCFRGVSINPRTLVVTPQQPIANPIKLVGAPSPAGFFYSIWTGRNGSHSLDHRGPNSTRCGYLEMNPDFLLNERSKRQELLRGPFGTIYANTTWYYSRPASIFYRPASAGWIEFDVSPYANEGVHESCQIKLSLPKDLPLDEVSVIRIFHLPPGYSARSFIVAIACYSPTGSLLTLTLNVANGGEWASGGNTESFPASFGFNDTKEKKSVLYGFPSAFPTASYENKPRPVWPNIASSALTVVNLHYARNQWVRQDSYRAAGPRQTRYLTYIVTSEDRQLKPVDETLQFGSGTSRHED